MITITITIDNEQYEAPSKTMTASELLALADISPTEHYLVELRGNAQFPYRENPDERVRLHPGSTFISVFLGPMPVASQDSAVSRATSGAAKFAIELRDLGYAVQELPDNHVRFPYRVEVGRFASEDVELGFVVPPDWPLTPPHGPHVSRAIHAPRSGGAHPTGGIHLSSAHSKHFGGDWQHWSRPFNSWANGPRTAGRYMAFIRSLWDSQ